MLKNEVALEIGVKVQYRGRFSDTYSLRGVVECFKDIALGDRDFIGVRLENGDFRWCEINQVRPPEAAWAKSTKHFSVEAAS